MHDKVTPLFSWYFYKKGTVIPDPPPPLTAYELWEEPEDVVDKPKNIHYDSNKVIIKELTCKRCGRSWIPRSKKKPIQCPKCKSPYWNIPKKKV